MKYKIEILPVAKNDMICIKDYISVNLQSPKAALNIIRKIRAQINDLRDNPYMYRRYEDGPYRENGLRFFPVDNYMVYYNVDEQTQTVLILRVAYGRQSSDNQLKGI